MKFKEQVERAAQIVKEKGEIPERTLRDMLGLSPNYSREVVYSLLSRKDVVFEGNMFCTLEAASKYREEKLRITEERERQEQEERELTARQERGRKFQEISGLVTGIRKEQDNKQLYRASYMKGYLLGKFGKELLDDYKKENEGVAPYIDP